MNKDVIDQMERANPALDTLPGGWRWAKLEDLVETQRPICYGILMPKENVSDGVLFVKVRDMRADRIELSGLHRTAVEIARQYARSSLRSGDLLLSIRGTYGRVAEVPQELDGGNITQDSARLAIVEGLDRSFIAHFLRSPSCQRYLKQVARGVAVRGVNIADVKLCPVPVAPINEQRRIALALEELLSDLDAGVAALERARANLKRYRAAVLKAAVEGRLTAAWRERHPAAEPASKLLERILAERRNRWEVEQEAKFAAAGKTPPKGWREKYPEPTPVEASNLPELPNGWCWTTVDQVAEVQGGIQKQPKRSPSSSAYPFLRVANVLRDRLELSEVHRIELFGKELEKLRLVPGDLLIVEGNGSKTEIGRSALWGGEIEDCVHQNHIIRVRALVGSPRYLNYYWNSPSGNQRVMEQAASTSGLYTLSVTKVCSLPVPLPPEEEQEQIACEVEERLSIINASEEQIAADLRRADRLRQSILKRAFEGKLVPQDPTDEPASALLERIKAERAGGTIEKAKPPRTRRGRRESQPTPSEE